MELKEKTLTFDDFQKFLFWLPRIQPFIADTGRPAMSADHYALFYKLMFYCALRPDEALNLKKSNFDISEKIISVRTSRTTKIQKTTIPPIILGDVKKILKDLKKDEYLFISKISNKLLNRQAPWIYAKDVGNLAGINVLQITEKREIKGMSLSLFRESYERFLSENKAERALIDLKLRNNKKNRFGNYTLENLKNFERKIFKTVLSDDEIQEYSKWYNKNFESYDKLALKVESILNEIIEQRQVNIHNIDSRAKNHEEFVKKISKGVTYDPKKMQDLAGVRIVCYVKSDVEKVKNIIEETFKILKHTEPNFEKSDKTDGYLHNQYVCRFTKERIRFSEELKKFENMVFEIQIRTILQNAWDEIEHDDIYKNSLYLSPEIKRRFFLVSKVLELTDNELDSLHREVNEESKKIS